MKRSCHIAGPLACVFFIATHGAVNAIDSKWSVSIPVGNYSVPGNWTPAGVPTNNGANVYNVTICAPAVVSIDGNYSPESLILDPLATAIVLPGRTFTLNANSTIDGTLIIGADGNTNPSHLGIGTSFELSGNGGIKLRGTAGIDSATGQRLTIGPINTVEVVNGTANFGEFFRPLAFTNNGNVVIRSRSLFNHPAGSLINAGTFRALTGTEVEIGSTAGGLTLENPGLFEADGANVILTANVTNTGTVLVQNGGLLRMQGFNNTFNNSGGELQLDNGGQFVPSSFTFAGGVISAVPNQARGMINGGFTLDGAADNDTIEISNVIIGGAPTVKGGLDLTNVDFILSAGGTLTAFDSVTMTGTGEIQLGNGVALNGGGANPVLNLASGIALKTTSTTANAQQINVPLNTAGPVFIDNANFLLSRRWVANGDVTLAANSTLNAANTLSYLELQGNSTQLGANAKIIGKMGLKNAKVDGSGKTQPTTCSLEGTNTVNLVIEPDAAAIAATITARGQAELLGSGSLLLKEGVSLTTNMNAAAPGDTLTTGPAFTINISNGHTLLSNLPAFFKGNTNVDRGVYVAAADLDNDGQFTLTGTSRLEVPANANIVAGSDGTITVGPTATFKATGSKTLGGDFEIFGTSEYRQGVMVVPGDFEAHPASVMTVTDGVTVNFEKSVSQVGNLAINNGTANFLAGLGAFDLATVNAGVFVAAGDVAGDELNIGSGGRFGGTGIATVTKVSVDRGTVEAGRTLKATDLLDIPAAEIAGVLINGAGGNATLHPVVGLACNLTGPGDFINEGNLTQTLSPARGGTDISRICTNFVQKNTGRLTVPEIVEIIGNSTIAGRVDVPEGGSLIFRDGTGNVSAIIVGGGTLAATGNPATGSTPTVNLTGEILLPADIFLRNSKCLLDTVVIPVQGLGVVRVTKASLAIGFLLSRLLEDGELPALDVRLYDASELKAVVKNLERERARVATLNAIIAETNEEGNRAPRGNDVLVNTLENIDFRVMEHATVRGPLHLQHSALRLQASALGIFVSGARVTGTADSSVEVNGGTLRAEGAAAGPQAPPATVETPVHVTSGGRIVAEQRSRLNLQGQNTISDATLESLGGAAGGVVNLLGPSTITNSTLISGSNPATPGLVISNLRELRNTLLNVSSASSARIELGAGAGPSPVSNFSANLNSAAQVLLNNLVNPGQNLNLNDTGTFTVHEIRAALARVTIAPGLSPGRLNINGNLTPGPGSDFIMEIGGTTQTTQYDHLFFPAGVLDVSHTALRPRFLNSFQTTITPADTFTIIRSAQPITGNFVNVINGRVNAADGSGSFAVSFQTGNTLVVLSDFRTGITDTDSDGMPDDFEQQYFGSPTAALPNADADGDGMTNLQEYRAGTNPIDGTSFLRIDEVRREGNDIVIEFEAKPDRSYEVRSGTDLTSFPTLVQTIAATATGGVRIVTDPGAASLPRRFYRAVLLP